MGSSSSTDLRGLLQPTFQLQNFVQILTHFLSRFRSDLGSILHPKMVPKRCQNEFRNRVEAKSRKPWNLTTLSMIFSTFRGQPSTKTERKLTQILPKTSPKTRSEKWCQNSSKKAPKMSPKSAPKCSPSLQHGRQGAAWTPKLTQRVSSGLAGHPLGPSRS